MQFHVKIIVLANGDGCPDKALAEMRQTDQIERGRGLDLLDELQAIRRLAVALELAVIGAAREARLNSYGEALAQLAGELSRRLERVEHAFSKEMRVDGHAEEDD